MDTILLVLHVFLSLGIIILVLLQKGAGASAGAAFGGGGGGGGGAGSVFGASGSANFLSKTTAFLAFGFFINSCVLAYLAANRDVDTGSVLDALVAPSSVMSEPAADDVPMADGAMDSIPAAIESDATSASDIPPADVPAPAGQ